eukprot:gene10087-15507_t
MGFTIYFIKQKFSSVENITTQEVRQQVDEAEQAKLKGEQPGCQPVLVDVREEKEYNVSHIPGAKWVPPGATYEQASTTLGLPRAHPEVQPLYLYCSVGFRSSKLAQMLQEKGETHVKNIEGSLFKWANEGGPLVDNAGAPTKKVHAYGSLWGKLIHDVESRVYDE